MLMRVGSYKSKSDEALPLAGMGKLARFISETSAIQSVLDLTSRLGSNLTTKDSHSIQTNTNHEN